ncbi:hypothetical protein ACWAUC_15240 [Bradyrhizobium guangdongense]
MKKLTEDQPPFYVNGRTIFQIKMVQGIRMGVAVCNVRPGADPAELCAMLNEGAQANAELPVSAQ